MQVGSLPAAALRVAEMVALRRDLHAHPELAGAEVRTTALLIERLGVAGLSPTRLPDGTGLICDVGANGPLVALRADLDALPLPDSKDVPYRSTVPGACHACGHDVHAAVVLGGGLALADLAAAGHLPGRVRLIFQPAEETMRGARAVIAAGGLDGVGRVLALHVDPGLEVGRVGLRPGAITGAVDFVTVALRGPGGHTARPQLTLDLVHALGVLIAEAPRRLADRVGAQLVWGRVAAGSAPNAIPAHGELAGTLRCRDVATWDVAPPVLRDVVAELARELGADAQVAVHRGVPPCVNDQRVTASLRAATADALGPDAATETEQSLGGEDFAWYTRAVPGALARLGTRAPGSVAVDLHQPGFDVDETAIDIGIRVLVAAALRALGES